MLLSYNMCKAKEFMLPTLLGTTAVTCNRISGSGWKVAWLWRPGNLEVSERVQS